MCRLRSAVLPQLLLALAVPLLACGTAEQEPITDDEVTCGSGDADSIFADTEACGEDPKADTGYVTSLDAREMELTLEGDVVAPTYDLQRAPLAVGQFALTYLRQKKDLYIQSLAEDYVDGDAQTEWKVSSGAWKKWSAMTSTERSTAKHFRLTGVNAVLLNASKYSPKAGKVFTATVPLRPTTLYSDIQRNCEGGDGHIQASNDVYWYVWDPAKAGCSAQTQEVTATVTKLLAKGGTVYPEYDKLYADKRLDAVVFFGQVDDTLTDDDYAFELIGAFERTLKAASFKKVTAPKGLRYERVKAGITAVVDIYSPREFAGLSDSAHVQNFYDAVKSHEVIIFNGHSVLGASDFWSNGQIYQQPTKYQIFLYNGCLGYSYYVAPILKGKQSPANVDIVSNVVETPFAIMVQESATALSLMLASADKGGTSSWQTILTKMNKVATENSWYGKSFYGTSGARTNTYKPRR